MDSSDISDQLLSVLPHSREPGRVSEVQKIMKQKKKKKIQIKDAVISARAASHCGRPQLTAQFYRASKTAARAAQSLREGAALFIPWDLPTLSSVPDFPVWIFPSGSVFLAVTKWFMSQFSSQIKERDGDTRARRRRCPARGPVGCFWKVTCSWVCASSNLAGLPPFLINWRILQRFYFINLFAKGKCFYCRGAEQSTSVCTSPRWGLYKSPSSRKRILEKQSLLLLYCSAKNQYLHFLKNS